MTAKVEHETIYHPSDYQLDRMYLNELSVTTMHKIREHLRDCLHCKSRLKLRENGLSAFPEVKSDVLLKRVQLAIRQNAATQSIENNPNKRRSSTPWRKRIWALLLPPVLCAAGFFFFLSTSSNEKAITSVRSKGGLSLRIFRQSLTGAEELISGQTAVEGDKIRFVVQLPAQLLPHSASLHAMLISVEAQSKTQTMYYPPMGSHSELLKLDSQDALPIATKLDNYQGLETLLLVICPAPFDREDVSIYSDPSGSKISVQPSRCHSTSFRLQKD